jgi:hypothetical protein
MPEVQKNESREQIKKLDKHRNINQTIASGHNEIKISQAKTHLR